jgi:transposase InsO family protein
MNHLEIPLHQDAPQANRAVNLPPFWTTNLQSWFTSAEGSLPLHNIANWVARFGVPATVTTDRGAQFTSAVWTGACTSLRIKHVLTMAYHPQSNGMVERLNRKIKDKAFSPSLGADGSACCA